MHGEKRNVYRVWWESQKEELYTAERKIITWFLEQ
jgi:hypothetical protein